MTDAVFFHGIRDVRIEPYPDGEPEPDTVEIDVAAVGICGSDLHYYKEGGIGPGQQIVTPFVPGHEFSGRLVEDDEALGLSRGTLVAVDPAEPCGACEWCHQGHPNLCPKVRFTGAPPFDGALRARMRVRRKAVIPVPDTISASDAAMLEPLGCCIHAFDLARPRLGETVAVIGCGPIGLGIIQLLARAPVGRILAADPAAYRARRACDLGAEAGFYDSSQFADATGGRGADLVIEATNTPRGFDLAVRAARIGGRIVIVGIPDGDAYGFSASEARRRGLTIRFSRRMGETYPRAIQLAVSGQVDLAATVSHKVPLSATPDAFEMQANLADNVLKTVVFPNGVEA